MRQLKSVKGSGCVGKYVVKTVVHTMMRVEGGGGNGAGKRRLGAFGLETLVAERRGGGIFWATLG